MVWNEGGDLSASPFLRSGLKGAFWSLHDFCLLYLVFAVEWELSIMIITATLLLLVFVTSTVFTLFGF